MNRIELPFSLPESHRGQVERILHAALLAADPQRAVEKVLARGPESGRDILRVDSRGYLLSAFKRVRILAFGKAAIAMSKGIMSRIGDLVEDGLVICKHLPDEMILEFEGKLALLKASHPVPGPENLTAAWDVIEFCRSCGPEDLVLVLISGGGSALLTAPSEAIQLADVQKLTTLLLASGADITEINTIRHHIDRFKGGGLARLLIPATVISLILSDVVGSALDVIASGPTVPSRSTCQQALEILAKYDLTVSTPPGILRTLQADSGQVTSNKNTAPLISYERVQNLVVADNKIALDAAREAARLAGFNVGLISKSLSGEAREVGFHLGDVLVRLAVEGNPLLRPACLIAGGETTVTVRGAGKGGRNQETALAAALRIAGTEQVAFITLATDGEDGQTEAAGAAVTGETLARAIALGLNLECSLEDNDSGTFFKALGDRVCTGPTGTNVNDLVFLFTW